MMLDRSKDCSKNGGECFDYTETLATGEGDNVRKLKDCGNMTELRVEIDSLDGEIIALLARRVTYIDRAAEIKMRDGIPANIPSRVEDVITKVKLRAEQSGLSPELAEKMWRDMIDWSIAQEEQAFSVKGI